MDCPAVSDCNEMESTALDQTLQRGVLKNLRKMAFVSSVDHGNHIRKTRSESFDLFDTVLKGPPPAPSQSIVCVSSEFMWMQTITVWKYLVMQRPPKKL